jgi:hypothetical protein
MSEILGTVLAPTTVPLQPAAGLKVVAYTDDKFTQQGRAVVLCTNDDDARPEYSVATYSEDEGLVFIECHIDDWDEARERFALWSSEGPEK